MVKENYGVEQIKTLEGIEAIRLRPGMYIGSVGPEGVRHITLEIISNAVDEYLNGHCTECSIRVSPDNEDNYIEIRAFGGDVEKINVDISLSTMGGHSGADYFMMCSLHDLLCGKNAIGVTFLDVSIESHLMCFAAEESRLNEGKTVFVSEL